MIQKLNFKTKFELDIWNSSMKLKKTDICYEIFKIDGINNAQVDIYKII